MIIRFDAIFSLIILLEIIFRRLLVSIFEMFLTVFIIKQPVLTHITNSDLPIILK